MKLLAIITTLLLSFSAFSQDLIEYNDGQFSRAGNSISFEEVEQLTKDYKVGFRTRILLNQAKTFDERAKPENVVNRNSLAASAATYGILGGGVFIGTGYILGEYYEDHKNLLSVVCHSLGAITIYIWTKASSNFSKPEYWGEQRDITCEFVKQELNTAMHKETGD